MIQIAPSRRIRRTPFFDGVRRAGVSACTVYNRMLLPAVFESAAEDYRHLKRHVQVWDVSCQRQVEIRGRDAARLAQLLTPRDLRRMQPGQCRYAPVVDGNGGMLNDPVFVKLGENHWWLSIADSDLLLWVKGVALGFGLNVGVSEPDVSPLAVQGPKARELTARVFGDEVREIGFFRFRMLAFGGLRMVVARSGFSRQGGFEIYVPGAKNGMPLWEALFAAGKDLRVRAGCPNLAERIEGGLLSYGNDMAMENNPYECGLGRYCNALETVECIGREALLEMVAAGPRRQIRPVQIEGDPVGPCDTAWPVLDKGIPVGQVTSAAWSPDFATTVAIGMIDSGHWAPGTEIEVRTVSGFRRACVRPAFWV